MADEGGGKAPEVVQAASAAKAPAAAKPVVKAPGKPPAPKVPEVSQTLGRQKLTREKLLTMAKPEIRAVAHDRGYSIGVGGRRVLAERFLLAQTADKSVLVELKAKE